MHIRQVHKTFFFEFQKCWAVLSSPRAKRAGPKGTRCLGGFSIMWVTKLLISPVKKKDFLPKNDQILPEIGIFVHCWLIWCPFGGLAGGCGVGCISQTNFYFI